MLLSRTVRAIWGSNHHQNNQLRHYFNSPTTSHCLATSKSRLAVPLLTNSRSFSSGIEEPIDLSKVEEDVLVAEVVKRLKEDEHVRDGLVFSMDSDCKLALVNAILDASEKPEPYKPSAMSGRHRRAIAISTFSELKGKDPAQELERADRNSDGVVDRSELRGWIQDMLKHDASGNNTEEYTPPTNLQWFRLCAVTALPMVFFGIMDNGIMILAGESVEKTIAVKFTLSTMACAGLGNLVSDVVGLGAGKWVEGMALKSGVIKNPNFSREQQSKHRLQIQRLRVASSVFGISAGCIIGMTPLLFI